MKNTDLVQLLRELGDIIGIHVDSGYMGAHLLAHRARQAAEEIEGRRVPSDEEILSCRSLCCHGPTFDSDLVQFARAVLARFGGGEGSDAPR